mmetsp:Transcript_38329/g.46237  ORF Transcript_38329/g.46237 Transcript_38329/m.46237 type:complete len:198 (+) Transcript_38329:95-688(+)|eukprot:CAMPEP_0197857212 /NCGR_PEP_ID=MMETSP1438-20131217/30072_1 /TAXON_ID=1461541 /ORGANISM="Pterosperma sp., Strain CCMP1384" /LENGTH=197 /DNA_ID=CAMNT_0043472961 /DNA_START=89 /DNA_END=682 /DNA_ORIENTATION=+
MPTNHGHFYSGGSGRDTYINCNNGGTFKSSKITKGDETRGNFNFSTPYAPSQGTGEKFTDKGNYSLRSYPKQEPQMAGAYKRVDSNNVAVRKKQKDVDSRLSRPKFLKESIRDLASIRMSEPQSDKSPYCIPRSHYGEVWPATHGDVDGPAGTRGGSMTLRGSYPAQGFEKSGSIPVPRPNSARDTIHAITKNPAWK